MQRELSPEPRERIDDAVSANDAGNVARFISVAHQTINLGGRPEWIQTLSLEDLKTAEKRLYQASLRHEARSVMPLMAAVGIVIAVGWALNAWANRAGIPATDLERLLLFSVGLMLAGPLWLNTYDIRRRNRAVVRAAEQRWAEVTVEIALRSEIKPPPARRVANWLKSISESRARPRNSTDGGRDADH